jgi:hypothetical protein
MLTNIPFSSPVSFFTAANLSSGTNPESPASIRPNAVIVRADVTRDRKKAVFVDRDRES